MTQTMAEAVPQNPEGSLEERPARAVDDPAAARTLLRSLNLVNACSQAPMTVAELGKLFGLELGTAAYRVRQLVRYGLVQPVSGASGRGQRYAAPSRWTISHTVLAAETLQTFLHGYFQRSSEAFFTAYERHLNLGAGAWTLSLDFQGPDYLQILSEHPGSEAWQPLVTHPMLRLTAAEAAALHTELLDLLRRHEARSAAPSATPRNEYYLGLALTRGLR